MRPNINPTFYNRNIFNNLDLSVSIYKWMPLKYLLVLLKEKKLFFNHTKNWEDVYENFLLKQLYALPNGIPVGTEPIIDGVYGQCWSLTAESDALWRIYSNISDVNVNTHTYDNIAVRIETTAKDLFDTIYTNDNCMASAYIGKVEYVNEKQLSSWLDKNRITKDLGNFSRNLITSQFIKREPFEHEKEVRPIFFLSPNQDGYEQNLIQFPIDPNEFVRSFVLDPRLGKTEILEITSLLINAGVNMSKIRQSNLYQFQPKHYTL